MEATNNPTEYKQFLYKKVIEAAYEAFTSKGIRAVKMDDLAKALSISKRTLYEIFDDKEQLLLACIEENSKCFREHMEKFALKKNPSPIAIILEFYRFQIIQLNNIRPEFFVDINRYPKAVKWINPQIQHEEDLPRPRLHDYPRHLYAKGHHGARPQFREDKSLMPIRISTQLS